MTKVGGGGGLTGQSPEIHHQLLGLTDVQREVVVVTSVGGNALQVTRVT